jgi:hypothetical protein
MIRPEQVFLHLAPVDMPWGMDRLSLLIRQLTTTQQCDAWPLLSIFYQLRQSIISFASVGVDTHVSFDCAQF